MPMRDRIQHIPSSADFHSPVEAGIRWLRETLEGMLADVRGYFGARSQDKAPHECRIELDGKDCFVASLTLPKASWSTLERAISLRIREVSPIEPATTLIAARASFHPDPNSIAYDVVVAEVYKVLEIESEAKANGAARVLFFPEQRPDLIFHSTITRQRLDRRTLAFGLGSVALLFLLTIGSWGLTAYYQDAQIGLLAKERQLRLEVAQEALRRGTAEELVEDVETYLISSRVGELERDLAAITAALPEGVALRRMRWSANGVELWLDGHRAQVDQIDWPSTWRREAPPATTSPGDADPIRLVREGP
jgi:hypothetical protein